MIALKRILLTICLLATLAGGLSAQGKDTLGLPVALPTWRSLDSSLVTDLYGMDTLTLSRKPGARELVKIFVSTERGRLDPFVSIPAVIAKGDSAVAALDTVLFSDSLAEIIHHRPAFQSVGDDKVVNAPDDTIRPNRLYAVMVLEGMASKASYQTLLAVAQKHANADVRGVALRALANEYRESDRLQRFVPDKELIHLLLINVDDTTTVPYLEKSFGQVAREGLIGWMGQDFGEPQGKVQRLKDAKPGDGGTIPEYRESWWQLNSSKIVWDNDLRRFRVR